MRVRIFAGVILLGVSASCYALKPVNESFIGVGVENFQWTESAPDGTRYLKESGQRYLLTLTSSSERTADLNYDFRAEIYVGGVNYDGQTQSSDPALDGIPLYSTTKYTGARTEILFNRYFATGQSQSLGIMGGIGLDIWKRDLPNSYDIQGHYVYGYTETYVMGYLKLGGVWNSQSPWHQKLSIGVKYPIFIDEYISSPSITLNPNPTTTTFLTWQHLLPFSRKSAAALELFVERTHFDISNPVSGYAQPDSDMRAAGLRILFSF